MKKWNELATRLTRKYNDTHRHLDKWESFGKYSVLSECVWDETYDNWQVLLVVEVEVDAHDIGKITDALTATFDVHGCGCEHDCCGCISTLVNTVAYLGNSTWAVHTASSRNI